MILAVDIGNTMTKFGLHSGERWVNVIVAPTRELISENVCREKLRDLLEKAHGSAQGGQIRAGISSVVPHATGHVQSAVGSLLPGNPVVLSHTLPLPLSISVKYPERVGTDRIANMIAAKLLHAPPVIVIDCGTATKYDVLDAHGDFIGGVITTGIQSAIDGLSERTAQLPSVPFGRPEQVIGRYTEEALTSGAYYSRAGEMNRIVEEILRELRVTEEECRIIGTGGLFPLVRRLLTRWNAIEHRHMTLDGIRLLIAA